MGQYLYSVPGSHTLQKHALQRAPRLEVSHLPHSLYLSVANQSAGAWLIPREISATSSKTSCGILEEIGEAA